MFGLFCSADQREAKELKFKLLKQREGELVEWLCRWDLERMEFYEIEDTYIDDEKEEERIEY